MYGKRIVSLCTRTTLLALPMLALSACGWFFVHGPPAGYQGMSDFSCTQSIAGPVLDLAGFTWFTINMDVNARNGNVAATAIDGALTIAFVWAGIDGARKISACRTARSQFAYRPAPARAPAAGQPVVLQPGPEHPTALQAQPAPPKAALLAPKEAAVSSAAPAPPAMRGRVMPLPADSGIVQTVTVTPAMDSVSIAHTLQLGATARTSSGAVVPNRAMAWRSSHRAVATVNQAGLVTARAVGTAIITARTGGVVGKAKVVVVGRH